MMIMTQMEMLENRETLFKHNKSVPMMLFVKRDNKRTVKESILEHTASASYNMTEIVCTSEDKVDLSYFVSDCTNVVKFIIPVIELGESCKHIDLSRMFKGCSNLEHISLYNLFCFDDVKPELNITSIFESCPKLRVLELNEDLYNLDSNGWKYSLPFTKVEVIKQPDVNLVRLTYDDKYPD